MIVESFSSIAGNQRDLYRKLVEILKTNKSVFFIKEGVTVGEESLILLNCCSMFESEMLKKRQSTGREKARNNGTHIGRPEITEEKKEEIIKRRLNGEPVKSVAKNVGVGIVTVCKYSKF